MLDMASPVNRDLSFLSTSLRQGMVIFCNDMPTNNKQCDWLEYLTCKLSKSPSSPKQQGEHVGRFVKSSDSLHAPQTKSVSSCYTALDSALRQYPHYTAAFRCAVFHFLNKSKQQAVPNNTKEAGSGTSPPVTAAE